MKSIDHNLTARTEVSSNPRPDPSENDRVTIIKSELQNLLNPLPKEVAVEELMKKLSQWITDKTNGRYTLTENNSHSSSENPTKLKSPSIPVSHALVDSGNLVRLQEYNALTQNQELPILDLVNSVPLTESIQAQTVPEFHEVISIVDDSWKVEEEGRLEGERLRLGKEEKAHRKISKEEELVKAELACKSATAEWNNWSSSVGKNVPRTDPEYIRQDNKCQDTWKEVGRLKEELRNGNY